MSGPTAQILAASDVSLGYPTDDRARGHVRPVLEGVTLSVNAGELVALVGPNGAGKTTLLRAMAGTHAPSSGAIQLCGEPIERLSRLEVARTIAVVPQDLPSADGLTVRDVVAMGRAPHQGRWLRASSRDDEIVASQLSRLGLDALADRAFDALSGGERRRALVAQALAQQPKLLLLDEPAAFLDLRHALELFAILEAELARGLAVVASIHDPSLVMRYASRVALLGDGVLAALGPSDDVMTPATLGRAFGVELCALVDPATGARALVPLRPA